MQLIEIDWIIEKLKLTDEWQAFYNYLKKNKKKFGCLSNFKEKEVDEKINYILWKNIIYDLLNDKPNLKWLDEKWILDRYNNWWEVEKIDVIKKVKNKFIKLFIDEVHFCPFCWKTPLILFNRNDKKNTCFLEKVLWKINSRNFDDWRLFDLDHFFPKSNYKYLSINFYNLIPICKWCNYIKNNKNPLDNKKDIFNPYFWFLDNLESNNLFDNKFCFGDEKIFESNHFIFFKLDEIYLNSQDTINDILFIRDKIEKIKTEKNNWDILNLNFSLKEKKEIFFKNYYPTKEQDILKYSNWKLKKDLIENLKIEKEKSKK